MLLDGGGGGLLNVTGLLENDEDCGKFSEKDEGPNDEGNEEGEGIGFVNVVVGYNCMYRVSHPIIHRGFSEKF